MYEFLRVIPAPRQARDKLHRESGILIIDPRLQRQTISLKREDDKRIQQLIVPNYKPAITPSQVFCTSRELSPLRYPFPSE
jgi:hypothetical protein